MIPAVRYCQISCLSLKKSRISSLIRYAPLRKLPDSFSNREIFAVHLIEMGIQLGAERGQVTPLDCPSSAQAYLSKNIRLVVITRTAASVVPKMKGFRLYIGPPLIFMRGVTAIF